MITFLDTWQVSLSADHDAILLDIDGTLTNGGQALPGAVALLELLDTDRVPYLLLTNDGNHSVEEKQAHLARAGLRISPDRFISCGHGLIWYARQYDQAGRLHLALGDLGVPDYPALAGIPITRDPDRAAECAGVIVGEGDYDWQRMITAAVNFFRRFPDRPLVVPNPDSYWPSGLNGDIGIGAGGKARFISGILAELGFAVEPLYLGKPHPVIFQMALERLAATGGRPVVPARTVMIGDSLRSDIRGGNEAGMFTVLTLTGITRECPGGGVPAEVQPALVVDRLG